MLDSIYHMILDCFCSRVFGVKTSRFYHKNVMLLWASFHYVTCTRKSVNTSGLSILMHGVISLPDATSYDNLFYLRMTFVFFIGFLESNSKFPMYMYVTLLNEKSIKWINSLHPG